MYSVLDHTYFLLNCYNITNKQQQEILSHFEEQNLLTFHGTVIGYFMLHTISCVKILHSICGSTCITSNVDIVHNYEMLSIKNIYNISLRSQNDGFQLIYNELKLGFKIKL